MVRRIYFALVLGDLGFCIEEKQTLAT